MFELKKLKEERTDVTGKMREMLDRAKDEGRTLTTEESRKFDKLEQESRRISGTIRAQEAMRQNLGKQSEKRATMIFGDMAQALATGRRDHIQTRDIDLTSGAAAVQDPIVMDEIVHTLQPVNRLSDLGVQMRNIANYSQWPVVTAGPSVTWFSEGDTISADSALTISSKKVDLKTAVALVKVSKLWLQDSGDRGRRLVNTEIVNAINAELIRVVLSGASGSNEPIGLDNVTGVQTLDAGQSTLSDYSNHITAAGKLLAVDVPIENIGYVQGVTSWEQEAAFADTTDQPLMIPPRLEGMRNFATSAVLETYGAGTDETRIYMGDFSQMVIGIGGTFSMELVERYADTMHTAFMVYFRVDSTVLRPNNFVRIENIATA